MGSDSSSSFEAIAYQVEVGRIHVFEAVLNNSHQLDQEKKLRGIVIDKLIGYTLGFANE